MNKYCVRKIPSEKPKKNGWVVHSGSSSDYDFKLKLEGSRHISSGKKSVIAQGQLRKGGGRHEQMRF